jgi:hypothetical protein
LLAERHQPIEQLQTQRMRQRAQRLGITDAPATSTIRVRCERYLSHTGSLRSEAQDFFHNGSGASEAVAAPPPTVYPTWRAGRRVSVTPFGRFCPSGDQNRPTDPVLDRPGWPAPAIRPARAIRSGLPQRSGRSDSAGRASRSERVGRPEHFEPRLGTFGRVERPKVPGHPCSGRIASAKPAVTGPNPRRTRGAACAPGF